MLNALGISLHLVFLTNTIQNVPSSLEGRQQPAGGVMGSYVGQILDLEQAAPEELFCSPISPAEIYLGEVGPLERALQNQNNTMRSCVFSWELAHPLLLLKTLSCFG